MSQNLPQEPEQSNEPQLGLPLNVPKSSNVQPPQQPVKQVNLSLTPQRPESLNPNVAATRMEATNRPLVEEGQKQPDARTRINTAIKEYIATLQAGVFKDTHIRIKTALKPKIIYFRGKGWFLLNEENQQWLKIGDDSEQVVKFWKRKTAFLRKAFRLDQEQ
jgi:hypothetical protein